MKFVQNWNSVLCASVIDAGLLHDVDPISFPARWCAAAVLRCATFDRVVSRPIGKGGSGGSARVQARGFDFRMVSPKSTMKAKTKMHEVPLSLFTYWAYPDLALVCGYPTRAVPQHHGRVVLPQGISMSSF